MKFKLKKLIFCLTVASCYLSMVQSIDNAHFYKAPNVYAWPNACRFDGKKHYDVSDWETKIDFSYGYGSTKKAWDYSGKSTSLLNTPGNQKIIYIDQGIPTDQLTKELKLYGPFLRDARNYVAEPENANSTLCQLKFDGKFKLHDYNLNIRQNLFSGLYLQLLAPIRQVTINNISFEDLSNPEELEFTKTSTIWKEFKKNGLNEILNSYDFKDWETPYSKTAPSDITFLVGWQGYPASNKEKGIDIGLELKLGLLMPTGSDINPNYVFSVPTGYNGHWGVSFEGQAIIEYKKWLSLNLNVGSTYFINTKKTMRLKTDLNQQGFIKLMKDNPSVEEGLLWHMDLNAKLDHIFMGFSALVGYSFTKKENNYLSELPTLTRVSGTTRVPVYTKKVVNSDTVNQEWYLHTIHFMIDYDFSVHMPKSKAAPRLNFSYNYVFDGKNAYKNDIFGGGLGLDVRWAF